MSPDLPVGKATAQGEPSAPLCRDVQNPLRRRVESIIFEINPEQCARTQEQSGMGRKPSIWVSAITEIDFSNCGPAESVERLQR
jgi:hypothetical protein